MSKAQEVLRAGVGSPTTQTLSTSLQGLFGPEAGAQGGCSWRLSCCKFRLGRQTRPWEGKQQLLLRKEVFRKSPLQEPELSDWCHLGSNIV